MRNLSFNHTLTYPSSPPVTKSPLDSWWFSMPEYPKEDFALTETKVEV
jgi:hypothetical protein